MSSLLVKCWRYCDAVYRDDESPKIECDLVLKKDNDYCEVFFGFKEIFIVFRGSDDFEDWLSNGQFFSMYSKSDDVHYSFLNSYKNFEEELISLVKKHLNYDVYLLGHSRGGALATLAADYLSLIKPLSCITFGTPPVGNKEFRNRYNKKCIDHTNVYIGNDIVFTSVLAKMIGLRHVGKEYRVGEAECGKALKGIGWIGWKWFGWTHAFKVKAHLRDTHRAYWKYFSLQKFNKG
jgi:pimeloyl-ACP methyl ester carboxylesterase